MRKKQVYPPEYKARIVELVRAGRVPLDLAKEFDVAVQSIRNWVKQADIDGGQRPGLTTDERAELVKLRRQVAELREEREILKKFAAWSAQEANWTPKKRSDS
jgi:transposase